MAMFRNGGRMGMANPFSQRLLEDFATPLNVSGQPQRNPQGMINRPSPVYNRPAFAPPPQMRQPGGTSYEDMRFTGIARPQGGFGLRGDTGPEMFRDQLTNELVTKAQMDSLGGREALLTPSQKSSVAERNQADLFGMQAAQAKLAGGAAQGFLGGTTPGFLGGMTPAGPATLGDIGFGADRGNPSSLITAGDPRSNFGSQNFGLPRPKPMPPYREGITSAPVPVTDYPPLNVGGFLAGENNPSTSTKPPQGMLDFLSETSNAPTAPPLTENQGAAAPPTPPTPPSDQDPYATSVLQQQTGLDPLTKQLLFGLDGQGGFIPGAMQAAERTFFDDEGRPVVVPQEVAGFSDDQLRAQQLARDLVGVQSPYLQRSEDAYRTGIGQLQSGLGEQDRLARQATGTFLGRLGETDRIQRGATDEFGRRLGDIERFGGQVYDRFGTDVSDMVGTARGAADEFGQRLGNVERLGGQVYDQFGRDISDVVGTAAGTVGRLGQRLGESGDLLRQTTGAFDPSMTDQFYNPYEERVVQQTISDALEAGDKADISQRARDIARGGESAFGSRARLGAEERREALGRGLGEALGGIRSRGFGQAQQAAMGEFGRQQQARRSAASGLAGLAGQQYGAGRDFTSTLGGAAGQRLAAGTGYGSLLSGSGAQQLASQQRLAGTLGSAAGQRLSAGTGFGNLLSGVAGQQLGSQRQLAAGLGQTAGQGYGARTGLGQTLGSIGAQRLGAQQGYGGFLSGLGSQAQQAGLSDINTLSGIGGQQQQLSQNQLDAIRANAMQAQQAPLAQYQSLLPFIQTAPAGQFQTQTTFAPRPSPLQAGLATGLGTLGALGNFFGGTQRGGFGYAA